MTTATVEGVVADNVDGKDSTYWFEYGPTKDYGSETTHRPITITDPDFVPVSEELSGLDPETTYHYRLCAKTDAPACGNDETFTTDAVPTSTGVWDDVAWMYQPSEIVDVPPLS